MMFACLKADFPGNESFSFAINATPVVLLYSENDMYEDSGYNLIYFIYEDDFIYFTNDIIWKIVHL